MVRRMTPAQYNAEVRRVNAARKRAIDNYNAEVRRVNAARKRAIDNYNAKVRQENARRKRAADALNAELRRVNEHNRRVAAHNKRVVADHNRRVRANQERLRRELAKLRAAVNVHNTAYRRSVLTLTESFSRLEREAESGDWAGSKELFDLSESETANSVGTLNSLLAEPSADSATAEEVAALRATSITEELSVFDPDLDARWRGALFALHPENPDASRHFCTSAREMLSSLLETVAPDAEVLAADPNCQLTPNGSVTRRSRVRHCLIRQGVHNIELESFVENDLDNVVTLFDEFNSGTHGQAGRFDLAALTAIKARVEGAIQFVARIAAR